MFSRFRIDDLISQDEMSVVYLGVDEKTGQQAALRRFFVGSGGVQGIAKEDREGFVQAFQLLSEVDHPCLRRVIEAGLDDVDGVPYVATEWEDGQFLRDVISTAPLMTEEGELLIRQGLDLAGYLESFFGERAYWMKLHPDSVIVVEHEEERSFTFSLSLDRWMGVESAEHGLRELATLVEEACGLVKEDLLAEESPLQEWIRHVRETDPTVSEARGALDYVMHKPIGETPTSAVSPVFRAETLAAPEPVEEKPEPVLQMTPMRSSSSGNGGKIVIASLILAIIVIGGVIYGMKNTGGGAAATNEVVEVQDEEESVVFNPTKQEAAVGVNPEPIEEKVPTIVDQSDILDSEAADSFAQLAAKSKARITAMQNQTEFQASEGSLIALKKGKQVTVTGEVVEVRDSSKYFYFEFSHNRGEENVCFRLRKDDAPEKTKKELKELYEGKSITAKGKIDSYRAGSINRVFLELGSLADVGE